MTIPRSDLLHQISRLIDIPKIGEKTAQKLILHFKTEEAAVAAILSHDIASISEVDGIGQRYAISLSHEITRLTHGTATDDFLKTPESIRIYEQILEVLAGFCNSTYAKSRIHAFIPYPARCANIIADTQQSIELGMIAASTLSGIDSGGGGSTQTADELKELLRLVCPIVYANSTKRIRDRVLIATNRGEYDKAQDMFGTHIECLLIEDGHEFLGTARGYSKTYIAGREFYDMDLPEDISAEFIDLKKVDLAEIVPESVLLFFEKNIKSIHSAILAARLIAKRNPKLTASFDPIYADLGIEGMLLKLPVILQSQSQTQSQPEKWIKGER
ncbi:MAG TPA: helix-hairpin-helix domain-containing protein, partial [Anaerovoracaceae bacterium]|nr:helix-hairpin-helix domain-containing protein [Anaerovoracaceae bacterium]